MRHLLPLLPKPSRYLGIENGSVHKDPALASFRMGLAFPDKYEVGMSYLGHKILYDIVNRRPNRQAERVFAPDLDAAAILRAHNAPLCTLESNTPLAKLDALGFAVTHELCYTNVLYMLDLAGIPLRAADRAARFGRWPLVMAGGGCTLAGEPLAPFMDLMLLGEGETLLPEILDLFERAKQQGLTPERREDLLRELARIPGVYVPEFFSSEGAESPRPRFADLPRPARRVEPDMDRTPYPVNQVIPFGAVHNRLALEIGRGCTRGCRFCQAGMTYRPVRERSVSTLTDLVDQCLSGTGYGELSFLSLSSGDFSALKTLFTSCVSRCAAEEVSVSLPSLRVGSVDDSIMGAMAGIRRTGATLAPEAGSQRLRDIINKGVSEEDLILHVQKLFEHGWQQVKLYFMIGLPGETDDDLAGIVDLCRKARDAAGPGIKRLQITAAISPFVPKPHTPFQWEAQISREEIRRRIGLLLEAFRKEKRITMRWHEPEVSFLEGVFSRGDRRLAPVLERAYRKGAVFAGWMEHFTLAPWLEALEEEGLSPESYQKAVPLDAPLAWDHLENGVSRAFLLRERERALAAKTSPDCRYEGCLACGACDTAARPSLLPPLVNNPGYVNRLNYDQRDQERHNPKLDEHGRVKLKDGVVRGEGEKSEGKAKPPAISEHLTRKAAHLRLWYECKGLAAYLSQLELQSLFERAFRRADLPLAFSQGFHPLPLLSFCRALPVGVASEGEWLSVYLREHRDPAFVAATLGEIVPGLKITGVEALEPGCRPAEASRENYRLAYTGPAEKQTAFFSAWRNFAALSTLPWRRETKKGPRDADARSFFFHVAPIDENTLLFNISWENGYLSPLGLVSAVLRGMGTEFSLSDFSLTKLRAT